MPRPIWKGAISFGLVTIPVNLYSAIERRETLSFNLLHKKDNARIQNKRFCSEEGVEVPWSEVVKGYEYAKSETVCSLRRRRRTQPPDRARNRLGGIVYYHGSIRQ